MAVHTLFATLPAAPCAASCALRSVPHGSHIAASTKPQMKTPGVFNLGNPGGGGPPPSPASHWVGGKKNAAGRGENARGQAKNCSEEKKANKLELKTCKKITFNELRMATISRENENFFQTTPFWRILLCKYQTEIIS